MNNIKFQISQISFKEATQAVSFDDLKESMFGSSQAKFSMKVKKFLILCAVLFIPLTFLISFVNPKEMFNSSNISITIAMLALLLVVGVAVYLFLKPTKKFLYGYSYKIYCYQSAKLAYLSYFCAGLGMDNGNYWLSFLMISCCLISFLFLYRKVEENMIMQELNSLFNKNYVTSKILNVLLQLSGVVIVIILAGMQLYRMNKWWLRKYVEVGSIMNESNLFDDLVGIIGGIPLLLLITLIPTYLFFKPKIFVKKKLLEQYSEEFREQYNFPKKEWYGE